MAENSAADRTERATPKRIRDARKRGEVARSRELASFVVVGSGVGMLMALGAGLVGSAAAWMRRALSPDPALLDHPADLAGYLGAEIIGGFAPVLPLLLTGLVAGLLGPILLGGWNLSAEAIKLDLDRVNPLKGLGRVFSANSLVELGKGLLKVAVLGGVFVIYLYANLDRLLALGREPPNLAMAHGLKLALACLAWMAGGLFLIAAVDAPYQLWAYAKRLRMTKQEVKQEYKEAEGSPEVKGRLRRLQQEVAQRRMMQAVPTADVVVVNPTHYAVALKYEAGKMRAPRVIAKGVDLVALSIRELAQKSRIPVVSAPPLARALYRNTRLDDEIPANLYAAVAQVLSYIYQLRSWRARPGPAVAPPSPPVVGDVPGGEPDESA
ncbi:flagellar biosynthesis protein FlhB [Fontimonas sp. SYSU GA230001]|uniref:flagellar biosynthesis protein FlhB n=1 Tax=Fontimonas sp. SYSU GA230001 TaxID=3142450 RepID=UPI0032B44EDB